MPRTSAVLLLVIGAAALACKTAPQWTQYTSNEGHYSVLFPGQPQLKSQEETAADEGKIQQYLAISTDSSGAAYMVGYFDTGDRTYSFDKGRDGALSRVKGTLISERDINLSGYPGREVRLSGKTANGVEFFSAMRFYKFDKRVFIAQFIVPNSTGGELPDKAVKFFDSLQVQTD